MVNSKLSTILPSYLMLHIAIIEDHFIYRKGLLHILNKHYPSIEILEIGTKNNTETALVHFNPDLIIMQLDNINEREGFNQATKLKSLFPKAPLIIYEEDVNYSKALKALRAKVSGYLDKACDEDEVLKCIQTVMAGKNYLCAIVQQNIIDQVIQKKISLKTPGVLSLRESEVARLVSDGQRTSGIAQLLGLKSSTVSTVKATVFAKLGVRNVVELRIKMAKTASN